MAQPVFQLSVDLVTKTATFESGMATAARSAREAFRDIGESAQAGGNKAAGGVTNVRASLGLLDNTIRGNHAAAVADLIRLFSQSSVVMAALPLAATAGGILLLGGVIFGVVQKIREMKEEQEKLGRDMTDFGTYAQDAFNGLDEKLLESMKKADELRNDHLGALRNELRLIDLQSMGELEKSFDELAKKTDIVFEELKGHWYTFGIGSDGAKHALEVFKSQYESLLSKGDATGATGLLGGTLKQAERIYQLQNEATGNRFASGSGGKPDFDLERTKGQAAINALRSAGVGFTESEVKAQELLVSALRDQETIQTKIDALKKQDSANAKTGAGNEASSRQAAAAREGVESMARMGEQAIAADKAVAAAQMAVRRASIEERLASDLDFANREYQVQATANQQELAALDKSGKDYANQLKALQDKALELTQANETKITELKSRAEIEANDRDLRKLEESEKEKIEATQKGGAARIAAINAALKEEESRQLQDTAFYRELLTARVEAEREAAEERAKLSEESGREEADNTEKLGEIELARRKEQIAIFDSLHRISIQQRAQQEKEAANEDFALKQADFAKKMAAINQNDKDRENKLKELLDKELQLERQHDADIAAIEEKSQAEQLTRQRTAMAAMTSNFAQAFEQVLEGHQTMARMMERASESMVQNLLQAAIDSKAGLDSTKLDQAKAAARWGFNWGSQYGGPAAPVLAPLTAATFFAGVMAFETGGIVPGVGRGDTVPAMLTPGETVLPKNLSDGLMGAARSGTLGGGTTNHVHYRPVFNVQTIDGDGVSGVLKKHSQEFAKHINGELRKLNR